MEDDRPDPSHGAEVSLPGSDPDRPIEFTPETLDRTVIAIPLLEKLRQEQTQAAEAVVRGEEPPPPQEYHVIIDLNLECRWGRENAKEIVQRMVSEVAGDAGMTGSTPQYIFAHLTGDQIRHLVHEDAEWARVEQEKEDEGRRLKGLPRASRLSGRAIYRIWQDFEVRALVNASVSTVKADAARASFSAMGKDIVWAVLDSGIQQGHRHFAGFRNLDELPGALQHQSFVGPGDDPLVDDFGHGTHVAGIIAGEMRTPAGGRRLRALSRQRDEHGEISFETLELDAMAGMAPETKLVSMKVLDRNGKGRASGLIAAIDRIQQINGYGRRLQIHGVNMSVGYTFEPEWFACGQSPLCVEVDRLVRSGVVVVVAAGNSGYGKQQTEFLGIVPAGLPLSINDPGNSELAITVGSTHRNMPHTYGVSYFSSKGPTGDGRIKPDLVAPGEKILSCAAGQELATLLVKAAAAAKARGAAPPLEPGDVCEYMEMSGTSMAAPHVSGVIAAFLSVRKEYIGRPEEVKQIFLSTATDLKRDRYFQGNGLVDLMRAIQSV